MSASVLLLVALAHAFGPERPTIERADATPHSHARRFVHRHSHLGIDGDAADAIGCAEAHAAPFEHMLTPSMLWCNNADCLSEFNSTYALHSIECTPARCHVLLHCADEIERIKWASLMTLGALIALIVLPLWLNVPALLAAARERTHGDKRL